MSQFTIRSPQYEKTLKSEIFMPCCLCAVDSGDAIVGIVQ